MSFVERLSSRKGSVFCREVVPYLIIRVSILHIEVWYLDYFSCYCLFSCEDAADMKNLEQSKVEAIAHDVEEKLFNLHQDINPKYKNKYRSLVFNLKDVKNQVPWTPCLGSSLFCFCFFVFLWYLLSVCL